MKIAFILAIGAGLLFSLTSCSKSPVEYQLTAEQLAWQGYQTSEVLRFGQQQSGYLRTYRVAEVKDELREDKQGSVILFAPAPDVRYQNIDVMMERMDSASVGGSYTALHLELAGVGPNPYFSGQAQWPGFPYAPLPLDEIIKGVPVDTLRYPGTKLLPAVTLGPVTYQQVIELTNPATRPGISGSPFTRKMFYAKGKGIVAFEEVSTGLWYRLP